jgi:hypothetical protein
MANPWLRLYAEFAHDPKVQSMSEHFQRRLVMLFCLRCSDVTVTLSDEDLAFQMRISIEELVETKAVLIRKGFIQDDWILRNWDKRQRVADQSASRTRAYRERKRDGADTSHVTASDALDTETETDTNTDAEKRKNQKKGSVLPLKLPSWLQPDIWQDWHQFRNVRKGWTAKARQLSLRTLEKLHVEGCCPREVVDQSIERGWTGLFAPKVNQATRTADKATIGKTMSAIMVLQEAKYGLDNEGIIDRLSEASLPQLGQAAGS